MSPKITDLSSATALSCTDEFVVVSGAATSATAQTKKVKVEHAISYKSTAVGDMFYADDARKLSRLAVGSRGALLKASSAASPIPAWTEAPASGDIVYFNSSKDPAFLAIGATGTMLHVTSGGVPAWKAAGASGTHLVSNSHSMPSWIDDDFSITFPCNGGGAALTTGIQHSVYAPYPFTIETWAVYGSTIGITKGEIIFDVYVDGGASTPLSSARKICGADVPTMASATNYNSCAVTASWSAAVSSGQYVTVDITKSSTLQMAWLTLAGKKTAGIA